MKAYFQLTIAQLRIFARNRAVIFFSLLFPVVLMVALGSFLSNGGGISLHAVVIDKDGTALSSQFIEELHSQKVINITKGIDEKQSADALKKGEQQLVILIPEGYEKSLQSLQNQDNSDLAHGARIMVYYDESNPAGAQVGLTLVNQAADALSKQMAGYKPWIAVQAEGIQAIQLKYIDFLVPGIVAMMIMSSNLNGVAGQISAWRERGILRRMQSTTLRASTFIAAQISSRLLLNGFQAFIVLLVGRLFFGTQVNGSWLLLILFVILGTLTFMSIGFIIAGLAKTPETAAPAAGFISFPMLFLGGVFFPIKDMPELIQPIVQLIPITHLSTALRQVMNLGTDLSELWPQATVLIGWMVAAFVIASLTFKWE